MMSWNRFCDVKSPCSPQRIGGLSVLRDRVVLGGQVVFELGRNIVANLQSWHVTDVGNTLEEDDPLHEETQMPLFVFQVLAREPLGQPVVTRCPLQFPMSAVLTDRLKLGARGLVQCIDDRLLAFHYISCSDAPVNVGVTVRSEVDN
jgi:hypothetical protein